MELWFLGTGAGDFRACEDPANEEEYVVRARELGGRNLRDASQALIAPEVLIDFHSDRQLVQQQVDTRRIKHLLITHCHWDHFRPAQILAFADSLPEALHVYGNETAEAGLEFASTYVWEAEEKRFAVRPGEANIVFHAIRPEQTLVVGSLQVTAVLANHHVNPETRVMEERALNYVVEENGRTLFYGLDSSTVLPGTMDSLASRRFDSIVLDATFGFLEIDRAKSGHHNFEMIQETVASLRSRGSLTEEAVVYGSHVSLERVPPHDDVVDEAAQMGITLAYDGLRVTV